MTVETPGRRVTTEGLARVHEVGAAESWLAVLVTLRPSGSAQALADPSVSVVNAGVLLHPLTGEPVVAFVALEATAKLVNLRARSPRDPRVPCRLGVDRGPRPGRAHRTRPPPARHHRPAGPVARPPAPHLHRRRAARTRTSPSTTA
jgi:hypothetical protein